MELHNLKPAEGSTHVNHRKARGEGSGWGSTAGRGHKGDKSRSGAKLKRAFEGGQTPMQRRLPKKGFKNPNRVEYTGINLDKIQALVEKYSLTEISPDTLYAHSVVGKNERFKILGRGDLNATLKVTAHGISEKAKAAVESKGGSVTII